MSVLSKIYDSTVRLNKRTGGGRNRWVKDSESDLSITRFVELSVESYADGLMEIGEVPLVLEDFHREAYYWIEDSDFDEEWLKDMVFANHATYNKGWHEDSHFTDLFNEAFNSADWKHLFMILVDIELSFATYSYFHDNEDKIDSYNQTLGQQEYLEDSAKMRLPRVSRMCKVRDSVLDSPSVKWLKTHDEYFRYLEYYGGGVAYEFAKGDFDKVVELVKEAVEEDSGEILDSCRTRQRLASQRVRDARNRFGRPRMSFRR